MTVPDRPWRAIIVDDEPPARRTLRGLLAPHADFAVVAECAHGDAALAACDRTDPDVIFLDVQMPGLDGFGVVSGLPRDRPPLVVFVTAYDRYAIQAFEARAVDYLLKPFSDERFAGVLAHVRTRLRDRQIRAVEPDVEVLADDHNRRARRLVLRDGGRTLILPWDDIWWIQAEDYCVRFHTDRGRPLVRGSLQAMAARLDPREFVRIHRSTVVNVSRVREVKPMPSGDYEVHLSDGTSLRMSRTWRRQWEAAVAPGVRR